ncbi:hypothetical protein AB0K74_44980, partial [Streptomyces sp. NPDC056159]|uniref:hypothetical protein n=1 Tax=unclassified Streptomyces TaxID=2593676 RepID=UPI00341627C0
AFALPCPNRDVQRDSRPVRRTGRIPIMQRTLGGHGSWLEPELNTGWPSAAFESATLWHPEETQKDFAVALKAFHESSSFTFIVVGVWLQENGLVQFNGDLSGE